MNAQDYISSGLLEGYVLGGLTLTESEQVAGAVCRFPDVALEVDRLEVDLLRMAEEDAVAPLPALEEKIWSAIQASGSIASRPNTIPLPVETPGTERHATKVIPFVGARAPRQGMAWARAAIWLALAGSVVTNFMLWSGRNADQQSMASLQQKLSAMGTQQQTLTASIDRYKREADMMAQPGMMPVPMLSTQPGHPMAATMYWDKAKNEAYVSVQKLPPPPAGMQYQLWAIADGKPVDLGMMDNEVAMSGGMQKVPKAIASSQAFAVSLEKMGGNPTPTADKIFLLGKMPA